ncbi:hypothetical protein AB0C52_24370 [Streptomyces sp. NPDC048717]|uniref:hypothetical protein n=1 Tax=Streptomyces sp. NPDC048717 TaxID=3154928 RepID=UPI003422FBB1
MSEDAGSARTRLNGLDGPLGPIGPGGGVFGSTPAEKEAAANTIATELEPSTKKAADGAKEQTNAAARALDGWETASGLQKVTQTWDQQVKMLMGRLSSEKASLRKAAGEFTLNDVHTGSQIRALRRESKLDEL